jgi:hypothetical protein
MNYFKKIYIPVIVITLSVVIFQLANSAQTFGVLVNYFFPCIQNQTNSFPCYGWVDLGVMAIATIVFVVCIIIILVRLIKLVKSK